MIEAAVVSRQAGEMLSDSFSCILSYQYSFSRSRGGSAHHLFVCRKHQNTFHASACGCGLAAPEMVLFKRNTELCTRAQHNYIAVKL